MQNVRLFDEVQARTREFSELLDDLLQLPNYRIYLKLIDRRGKVAALQRGRAWTERFRCVLFLNYRVNYWFC